MESKSMDDFGVKFLLIIGSCLVTCSAAEDFLKSDHKHRTHKAAERANELWCYKCSTMDIDKEYCMNVSKNDSSIQHKCDGDIRACMVKRISYSTTTNGTSNQHKLWSLERNCSQKCEPGCIVIGERLKLYKCTSCCEGQNFCNYGSGAPNTDLSIYSPALIMSISLYFILNTIDMNSSSGERTKIHICSKCCEFSFCNIGTGNSNRTAPLSYVSLIIQMVVFAWENGRRFSSSTRAIQLHLCNHYC